MPSSRPAIQLALVFGLVFAGCPEPDGPPVLTTPAITLFEAEPYSVRPGGMTTVTWAVEDATVVRLSIGDVTTEVPPSGAQSIQVQGPTRLLLHAENENGTEQANLQIVTPSDQKVRIVLFEVSPRTTQPDEPVEVRWETVGATGVSLLRTSGVAVMDPTTSSGRQQFRFRSSATLRLVARGLDGPATAEASIEVVDPAPLIELFEATNPRAFENDSLSLRIRVRATQELELFVDDQLINAGFPPTQEIWEIPTPSIGSHTLRLRAISASGVDEALTQVLIIPRETLRIQQFDASATLVGRGGTTELSWVAVGSEQTTITPDGDRVAATGRSTRTINSQTSFTLQAQLGSDIITEVVTVMVDPNRPALNSRLEPEVIAPGETASLIWQSTTSTQVELLDAQRRPITQATTSTGSFEVQSHSPTSFIIRALGPGGVTEATHYLDVDSRPQITQFILPPRARSGFPVGARIELSNHQQAGLQYGSSIVGWLASEPTPTVLDMPQSPNEYGATLTARARRLSSTATQAITIVPRVFDDTEPNDTPTEAIGPATSYPQTLIGTADPVDMVRFAVPPNRRLRVNTQQKECPEGELEITIIPDDIGRPNPAPPISVQGLCPQLIVDTPGLADWSTGVLRIRGVGGNVPYRLVLDTLRFGCSDNVVDRDEGCDDNNRTNGDGCSSICQIEGTSEMEPNNGISQASPASLMFPVTADLYPRDRDVWFVDLSDTESGTWLIALDGPDGLCPDLSVSVLDDTGIRRARAHSSLLTPCPSMTVVLPSGRSFVSVDAADLNPQQRTSPVRGQYTLSVTRQLP